MLGGVAKDMRLHPQNENVDPAIGNSVVAQRQRQGFCGTGPGALPRRRSFLDFPDNLIGDMLLQVKLGLGHGGLLFRTHENGDLSQRAEADVIRRG